MSAGLQITQRRGVRFQVRHIYSRDRGIFGDGRCRVIRAVGRRRLLRTAIRRSTRRLLGGTVLAPGRGEAEQ